MPSRAATPPHSVAELLRIRRKDFTPAESRVAQRLLADYPAAGFQSVAALAASAAVSGPTVLRAVGKLGFQGYGGLQRALRAELSARIAGPLASYPDNAGLSGNDSVLDRCAESIGTAVGQSLAATDPVEFQRAVRLLADPERPVLLSGGRFSWLLAEHLGALLGLLRPGVSSLGAVTHGRTAALLDVTEAHTVVVFDYRRYERASVRFGKSAVERGATLILITDPYLSPLSSVASVLLTTVGSGPPPFVTFAPALALNEALVVGVVDASGTAPRQRLAVFDVLTGGELEGGPSGMSLMGLEPVTRDGSARGPSAGGQAPR